MLPRLILLALLAAGGLQAASAAQNSNMGLRRFVDRVRLGGIGGAVGDCTGSECANRSDGAGGDVAEFGSEVKESNDDEEGRGDDIDEEEDDDQTDVEEGRGKKGKKKKGYGKMMMMLVAFSKAAMLYVMIHAVAAVAGKALIVAKVALAIATALALKKSLDHKTSYEIVKHPQYSHVQTHSSSVDYDHGSSGGGGGYEGGSRRRRRAAARR